MPAELSHLYQAAVLWAATGVDVYGRPTLTTPIEIRVRWDDTKKDVLTAHNQRIAVDAVALVDRDIVIGSELWLGRLDDWVGTGTGQNDDTVVMTVVSFASVPDIRARYYTRDVGLKKKSPSRNAST